MESGEPNSPAKGRLDSWKAIADYLGREVRSAQRWERERGLPVYRVPGEGRGVVFAFSDELDAWLKGRRRNEVPGPEASAQDGGAGVGPEEPAEPPGEGPKGSSGAIPATAGAATPGERAARKLSSGKTLSLIAGGLALLLAGAYLGVHWRPIRPKPLLGQARPGRVMLAVLPFLNLSGDPSQDYFSDGRELSVGYILEGSVRRAGSQARISAQLIRVSDQTHLWAQDYQVQVKNILSVQEDVAESVANRIRVSLSPRAGVRLAPVQAANSAAYDDYLRGLFFWNRRTAQSLHEGIKYFQRAIREDPDFAPAQAGLADRYINFTAGGAANMLPQARAAALKALAIDAGSADAHTALAAIEVFQDWDWAGAEREFRRALELDPNDAHAHHWYANLYLDPVGRLREAIDEMQSARQLDPMSLVINTDLGWAYELAGDDSRALSQYLKVQEMDPAFPGILRLDYYDLRKGMYESWMQNLSAVLRTSGFAKSAEQMNQLYSARTCVALRGGLLERQPAMLYLNVDPAYAVVRASPCYGEVAKQMGLPQLPPSSPATYRAARTSSTVRPPEAPNSASATGTELGQVRFGGRAFRQTAAPPGRRSIMEILDQR